MSILILGQQHQSVVDSATWAVMAAAVELNEPYDVILLGTGSEQAAQTLAQSCDARTIYHSQAPCFEHGLAENVAPLMMSLLKKEDYHSVLAPANTYGKNILPRVAAQCDVMQLSDVIKVIDAQTFDRPIYAGNAIERVQLETMPYVMSIRPTAFDWQARTGSPTIQALSETFHDERVKWVGLEATVSERPELSSAQVVVSGGRGVGSKDNFKLIEALADKLGAAVGASRAAVDANFISNDHQVGQTGKIVAPALYIAVGISGAVQHLAGMKDAKVIVAINKDPDAAIFEIADYGLVGDLFDIIPRWVAS